MSNSITLSYLKSQKEIFNDIKTKIPVKYGTANIGMNEILEFINNDENLKIQVIVPELYNAEQFIQTLTKLVEKEFYNRINSGEINIISKLIEPYNAFFSNLNNKEKAINIIETTLKKYELNYNQQFLTRFLLSSPLIIKIVESFIKENQDNIKNNNWSFTNGSKLLEYLIKIYYREVKKQHNKNNLEEEYFQELNQYAELKEKLENSKYAKSVKRFLTSKKFINRHIYILLLRFNLFDYKPIEIEKVAEIFGVTTERIKQDQNRILVDLVANNLAEELSKLFPYTKEAYQTIYNWYRLGFNETGKYKDISNTKKTFKYQENLANLLRISKDELDSIIIKLDFNNQKLIEEYYTPNYDVKPEKKTSLERKDVQALTNKIKKLILNPNYKTKNTFTRPLHISLKIKKNILKQIINELSDYDVTFINKFYTEEFEWRGIVINSFEKECLQQIKNKILKLKPINNANEKKNSKYNRPLYEILQKSKEELVILISKLNNEDQEFLKKYFDEDFNRVSLKGLERKEQTKIYAKISYIKSKLIKLIENPNVDMPKKNHKKEAKTLYDFYEINKEELINIILLLHLDQQSLLKQYYNEDFILIKNDLSTEEKKNIKRLKTVIRKLLINPNYLNERRTNNKKSKTLYECVGITKEELIIIISKLSIEQQRFIKTYYNDEFIRIKANNLSSEEKNQVNYKLAYIKQKIKNMSTKPKAKAAKPLYKFYKISKEELEEIIAKLPLEDQDFIKQVYDSEYIEISTNSNEEEKIIIRNKIKLVKTYIRKLIKDKDYFNKKVKTKTRKTLYELLKIDKETLINLISKLSIKDQEFLSLYYTEDYLRKTIKDNLDQNERIKINGKLTLIRNKIIKLNTDPNYKIREKKVKPKKEAKTLTLYERVNVSKEELILAINKLNDTEKEILNDYYNEDFIHSYKSYNSKEEGRKKQIEIYGIVQKLKRIVRYKNNNNLLNQLKLNKTELTALIEKLPLKDQQHILQFYDENFDLIPKEYNDTENRRRKYIIKKLIDNQNPPKSTRMTRSLCERIGMDFNTTKELVALLKPEEQQIILNLYNINNKFAKKEANNSEMTKIANQKIIPRLKKLAIKKDSDNNVLNNALCKYLNKEQTNKLNILELIILMSLSTGETYSTKSIAKYLGMDEYVVKDIIENYLISCKEKYNNAIDIQIKELKK